MQSENIIKSWNKSLQQCAHTNRWQIYHKQLILFLKKLNLTYFCLFPELASLYFFRPDLSLKLKPSLKNPTGIQSEFCLRAQNKPPWCSNMQMYQQWWILKGLIASKVIVISIFREVFVTAEGVTSAMRESQRCCQFLTLARSPHTMPQTSILIISGENSSHFGRL